MAKCKDCKIYQEMSEGSCCAWFLDNVICGDKTKEECTEYIPCKEKGGEE